MGFQILSTDIEAGVCRVGYELGTEFCHSVNVVQGGFIATMIDATMAHLVMAIEPDVVGVNSLELKVSYLAPTFAGKVVATARIVRKGRSIVFLEGELRDEQQRLTATASSTAKLGWRK